MATRTPKMDISFVSEGLYQGHLYKINHYPGVVYDESTPFAVTGEILKMNDPDALLPILDKYEHAAPLITADPEYRRVLRPVQTETGMVKCWVYEFILPVDPDTEIVSGKY